MKKIYFFFAFAAFFFATSFNFVYAQHDGQFLPSQQTVNSIDPAFARYLSAIQNCYGKSEGHVTTKNPMGDKVYLSWSKKNIGAYWQHGAVTFGRSATPTNASATRMDSYDIVLSDNGMLIDGITESAIVYGTFAGILSTSGCSDEKNQTNSAYADQIALNIFGEIVSLTDTINTSGSVQLDQFLFNKSKLDGGYQMLTKNLAGQWYQTKDPRVWLGDLTFAESKDLVVTWFFKIENEQIMIDHVNFTEGVDRASALPSLIFYLKDLQQITGK